MIESLLVANRGEIARRIIRTGRRLGVRTSAVYSEADAGLPFVAEADESVLIGPANPAQSGPAPLISRPRDPSARRSTSRSERCPKATYAPPPAAPVRARLPTGPVRPSRAAAAWT